MEATHDALPDSKVQERDMAINVTGPGPRANPGNDFFAGTAGNDTIFAGDGSDYMMGTAGADSIYGDGGLEKSTFIDTVDYSNSTAAVRVNLTQTTQFGGFAEGDRLIGIENVIGSAFNDILTGDDFANKLVGGAGLDVIKAGGGNDTIIGGIDGKKDVVDGGAGSDLVDYSDAGSAMTIRLNDTFRDGVFLVQRDGSAVINARTLSGEINGISFSTPIPAVAEDVLRNIENVIATAFNDTIVGNMWNNVFRGGAGADYIDGKVGSDTADYSMEPRVMTVNDPPIIGVNVDLRRERQFGGDAEGDRLISIENVIGSFGNDTINGNTLNNRLEGNAGNDRLYGRDGDDTFDSGPGADILDGGAGADTFIYDSITDSGLTTLIALGSLFIRDYGVDRILNFQSGVDKIDLSGIDAHHLLVGDQAFVFADSFTGVAGQLVLTGTTLRGDIDGDRRYDLSINVTGAQRSDIIL
jgi:Ca2+-binding RTX toxin-like protein